MMNRTVLVGRLTKDPELRFTPNGVATATFTLAASRPFTNQQGERETDFINVVVWKKPAENVANFLKKGSLAGVDGRIQTRKYQNSEDKTVYVTEVVAESVQFLEPKKDGQQQNSQTNTNTSGYTPITNKGNTRIDEDPFSNAGQIDISDDDLPF